ncbi:hypothetical protein ZWY2020_036663 [Hordeum vulgare]|nr:hypothetical protein ZWY2020_036663 [Hordeum vulgare]
MRQQPWLDKYKTLNDAGKGEEGRRGEDLPSGSSTKRKHSGERVLHFSPLLPTKRGSTAAAAAAAAGAFFTSPAGSGLSSQFPHQRARPSFLLCSGSVAFYVCLLHSTIV